MKRDVEEQDARSCELPAKLAVSNTFYFMLRFLVLMMVWTRYITKAREGGTLNITMRMSGGNCEW
jgi:hypothetical protein